MFWNKTEVFICDHCNNVHNFKFNDKIFLFGTDDIFFKGHVLDFIFCKMFYL